MKTYGYAVAGYPTRQRPYGNFLKRYCFAGSVFCCRKQAAKACNMAVGTFYDKARKIEKTLK